MMNDITHGLNGFPSQFFLDHVQNEFTESGIGFICTLIAQGLLRSTCRVFFVFNQRNVPEEKYMFGLNRARKMNTDAQILQKFTVWKPELLYPEPTNENIYLENFQFQQIPEEKNVKSICDMYFDYRAQAQRLEKLIQKQRSLLTFNFMESGANSELSHIFTDKPDITSVETTLEKYDLLSKNLNANIFPMDFTAKLFENFKPSREIETLDLVSEDPLAFVPQPQKSDGNRFMTLEVAAVVTLVTLRFFYD